MAVVGCESDSFSVRADRMQPHGAVQSVRLTPVSMELLIDEIYTMALQEKL
ncbi:hypothetical protein DPMN_111434 [Dreissena polymorpha]|uniref:Uncharacterized protein n=1 Tax=Dreissena polymorpha TaxID=45954 RepID=A0A9D4KEI6_DREPO|nr:hypothetical protein DPMN_111434 [Dreissena polymorpha]